MNRGLLILLAALLPLAALGQTYKWKDEAGRLVFTQVPPRDKPYEVIGAPAQPATSPNQDSLNKALEESVKAEPERRRAAELEAQRLAARQEACRAALERLAYLDAHPPRRIATTDAQGQVGRMSEEEHQRQRAAQQALIQQNCE